MDIDKLTRWRVTPLAGRTRTFRNETDAKAHQAATGGRLTRFHVWQVRYTDLDGQQRSKNCSTRPDAEAEAAIIAADLHRGTYIDPRLGKQTFEAYADEWRALQVHQPATAVIVEKNLRLHINPIIGHLELAKIRPSHLQAWVKGVKGRFAASTIEVMYASITGPLRAAVNDGLIARNPCAGITLPEITRTKVTPWPAAQAAALAAAVPARFAAVILYAAGTGVRRGEAMGLTVGQLRMLERAVDVDWQLQYTAGVGRVLCRPKTRASRRTIPLPQVVLDALAAHMTRFPPVTVAITHRERDGTTFTADEQFVFTDHLHRPIPHSHWDDQAWAPGVAAAKLPVGSHFHELRHFYASTLIAQGVDLKTVQERLGHTSITQTADTYGHLTHDADDRTRKAIDDVLGGKPPAGEQTKDG